MSQWKIRRASFSLSCSHLVIVTKTIWLFNGLCFKNSSRRVLEMFNAKGQLGKKRRIASGRERSVAVLS